MNSELKYLLGCFAEQHDLDTVAQTLVLQEEVGEVSEAVLKMDGGKFFKDNTGASEQLRHELADVAFVVRTIAHVEGIDLEQATLERARENVERS